MNAALAIAAALFLLLLYYVWRETKKRLDDMMNGPGADPKGPHPLPANDSWFLNRKHRPSGD